MKHALYDKIAPSFSLADHNNKTHKLSDYKGKWVVIYFYPKAMTPGCTVQACGLRDTMDELQAIPCAVLGISADVPALLKKFVEKENLNFPLLSDTEHKVADAYGAWQEKSMYGKTYMGMARMSVLVDPKGIVRMVWPKVKPAEHVADIRMWFKENKV